MSPKTNAIFKITIVSKFNSDLSQINVNFKEKCYSFQKFSLIWSPNDVSQSYVIYYFEKCVTIS
jgi:hypothetical protein